MMVITETKMNITVKARVMTKAVTVVAEMGMLVTVYVVVKTDKMSNRYSRT